MHPTRGTRIHPKGLQSPLGAGHPTGTQEQIKAPFAGTICSISFLKIHLFEHGREAHSPECVEGEFSEVGFSSGGLCVRHTLSWRGHSRRWLAYGYDREGQRRGDPHQRIHRCSRGSTAFGGCPGRCHSEGDEQTTGVRLSEYP